jgi:hypothetical protein
MTDSSAPAAPEETTLDKLLNVQRCLLGQGYPDPAVVWWSTLRSWLSSQTPAPGTPSETLAAQARHQVLGELIVTMDLIQAADSE